MEKIKKREIIIIGGGITGLALLHYLCKKHAGNQNVSIQLFEREAYPGGTIQSVKKDKCLFEMGPNGFLSNKEKTLEFIEELGLTSSLVAANENAALRFISINNELHAFPMGPKAFFAFKKLGILSKLRIFEEPFIRKGNNPYESVYDFAKRRFGGKIAEYFVDPFISGIYAGDARNICVKSAFPQIYSWEQSHGSILKALKKTRSKDAPKPKLYSFKNGMGQIIDSLYAKYEKHIQLKKEVIKVFHREDRYVISTAKENFKADELYICAPAYACAEILRHLDEEISNDLAYINYAPVVVVGLLFTDDIFAKKPEGFGYLVPSFEKKNVLGVLFESNIYPNRFKKGRIFLRFMLGGSRHPDIHQKTKKELMEIIFQELGRMFPTKGDSALTKIDIKKVIQDTFIQIWPKAIPQYDQINMEMNAQIDAKLRRFRDLFLVGNYRGGVSFNDCIENAYNVSVQSAGGNRSSKIVITSATNK